MSPEPFQVLVLYFPISENSWKLKPVSHEAYRFMNGVTWETEFLHLKELLHTYSQNTYILIAFKQLYF